MYYITKHVQTIKLANHQCLYLLQEHESGISAVFVLPDNYNIISIEKLGRARSWSAETGVTAWSVVVQSGIAAVACSGLIGACASTLGTQ